MTFKEWNAVIMIAGQMVVVAWLLMGGPSLPGVDATLAGTAIKLLWVTGAMIGWNIVAAILTAILVGIVTRRETIDEPGDERDRDVSQRAQRNAYFITSIGGLISLVLFAWGFAPVIGVYVLFGALMAGGFVDSASRLAYYRFG